MENPEATRVPYNDIYDPAVALTFFKSAGTEEKVARGKRFFAENDKTGGLFSKGAKMYYLADGEVELTVGKKSIGAIGKGQVFGEMASISQSPRSATATAKTDCSVISLDDKQFQRAIAQAPEFALMLMSIVINRIRQIVAAVSDASLTPDDKSPGNRSVFDRKLLADLRREFDGHAPVYAPINKVIIKEGDAGVFMYVVLEGRVAIHIKDNLVEKVGPGGVIGEMALVDQSPRIATAIAEADTSMLAINRRDFLTFVTTKPDFSVSLLKSLADRLRFMNTQLR
ncbi:MAG TPA: cyclic nucleotide-binding domain-containing protein [Burkholderiales bacterium]|nr:cyclic nucleotide-binding domain-containing protein [Burkholderiales bacterium]